MCVCVCGSDLHHIDDEKMELFSKGCQTTTDCGCISSVEFGGNNITSEGIEHFVNIPQHIRQGIRTLELWVNKLDAHACDLLAKAVPEMPMLEELDLDNNPTIGAATLIRSLYTSSVKSLHLKNTGIGEEDCVRLSELLKSNPHLEDLDVGGNNLSSESAEMITSGATHSSSLRILDMSDSQFSVAAEFNLASLLSDQYNCKLEELELRRCNISSEGVADLATALCKNTTLHTLDLDDNPIGQEGAAALAQMLPQNRTLQRITLRDCNIIGEGVATVATCLHTLDLSRNPIGREGAAALAQMLPQNRTLESIDLRDCNISGEGVAALATALCRNTTLHTLKLDDNPIGQEGAAALAQMLPQNRTLKKITLRDCNIIGEGVAALATALCNNSTLHTLDLDDNPIGQEGAAAIAQMLPQNRTLRTIYLRDETVGEEGVRQLVSSLDQNSTLETIWLPQKYETISGSISRIRWL